MKKNEMPKVYYVGFIFALFYSAAAMTIAIGVYISMIQTPGGIGLQLFRLCLPVIAFGIVFFNLRFKYRNLMARRRAKQV